MEAAIIIMSVVGPLVGVVVAWKLFRRDTRADVAHNLFAKIFADMQNYRHRFMRLYLLTQRAKTNPGSTPAFPLPYDPDMELREKETDLNTDCLMLGLLFDRKADKAGAAIQNLIASSEVFNRDTLPTLDECNKNLKLLVENISGEIRELHKLLPTG